MVLLSLTQRWLVTDIKGNDVGCPLLVKCWRGRILFDFWFILTRYKGLAEKLFLESHIMSNSTLIKMTYLNKWWSLKVAALNISNTWSRTVYLLVLCYSRSGSPWENVNTEGQPLLCSRACHRDLRKTLNCSTLQVLTDTCQISEVKWSRLVVSDSWRPCVL